MVDRGRHCIPAGAVWLSAPPQNLTSTEPVQHPILRGLQKLDRFCYHLTDFTTIFMDFTAFLPDFTTILVDFTTPRTEDEITCDLRFLFSKDSHASECKLTLQLWQLQNAAYVHSVTRCKFHSDHPHTTGMS